MDMHPYLGAVLIYDPSVKTPCILVKQGTDMLAGV
jgi:hypothetical protein